MDVYGEAGRRAHRTGVVGVDAETEDTVDNLEVYEALVNPKEAGSGGNKGRGGMMPPMMMGGGAGAGAGGGSAAAATAGSSQAVAGAAGATARVAPGPVAAGTATAAPAAPTASAGVGAGSTAAGAPGLGAAGVSGGAGAGMPATGLGTGTGAVAAQSDAEAEGTDPTSPDAEKPPTREETPAAEEPPAQEDPGDGRTVGPDGRINPFPPESETPPDVVEVDPSEIERLAKQWSSLSDSMTGLSTNIANLQADNGAFGMVRDPEPVYGKMTDGLHRRSGGAAQEFEQISAGLAASAAAFRNTEDEAASSLGGITQ